MLGLVDIIVVVVASVLTLGAVAVALVRRSPESRLEVIAGRSLSPVVLALGAGATANSGFVLTGAVGLGYVGGLVWCLLPLGWLVGDIVFWQLLARRLYRRSLELDAVSLPEMLGRGARDAAGGSAKLLRRAAAAVLILLMIVYAGSQWLSAGKMGGAVLGLSSVWVAVAFATIVACYTALAGVRGAAYSDFIQGCFMLLLGGTTAVLVASAWPTLSGFKVPGEPFFFDITGGRSWFTVLASLVGFATMAIGFNLGQPQMVNRWMSARSVEDIAKARWIYIGFVQATWLSYTAFGALLRVVIEVDDPEQALVRFIMQYGFPGALGILIAGAISTIASTGSATLVVCGEILNRDLCAGRLSRFRILITLIIGAASLSLLTLSSFSVFDWAILSVSLTGASLAAPMSFVILGLRPSSLAAAASVVFGIAIAIAWRELGYSQVLNEAAPGLAAGLVIIAIDEFFRRRRAA